MDKGYGGQETGNLQPGDDESDDEDEEQEDDGDEEGIDEDDEDDDQSDHNFWPSIAASWKCCTTKVD